MHFMLLCVGVDGVGCARYTVWDSQLSHTGVMQGVLITVLQVSDSLTTGLVLLCCQGAYEAKRAAHEIEQLRRNQ